MSKIDLGDKVKDPVTGIYGIAYVRLSYLQGCDRIGIQPPTVREKGKVPNVPELFHVDEPQLEIITKGVVHVRGVVEDPGGPSHFGKDVKR